MKVGNKHLINFFYMAQGFRYYITRRGRVGMKNSVQGERKPRKKQNGIFPSLKPTKKIRVKMKKRMGKKYFLYDIYL